MSLSKLQEDIKKRSFSRCYLLYGDEPYMIRYYKNLLKKSVIGNGDKMNLSIFSGRINDTSEIISIAETLPFFSDYRAIVIEDSGLFSSANEFSDYIARIPETTVIIFAENSPDKRTKLFKTVSREGVAVEFAVMKDIDLTGWIAKKFANNNITIAPSLAAYFVERTGHSMDELNSEADKLISYVCEKRTVDKEDIDLVCSRQLTDRIFDIMDFIGKKDRKNALAYYLDLISLQESETKILFLINAHFSKLYNIKELVAEGKRSEISSLLNIRQFFVPKYIEQANNFSSSTLKEAIEDGVFFDNAIKTGQMDGALAVESMIIKYSGVI